MNLYLLSWNIGGTKVIVSPLVQKLGGHVPPETRSLVCNTLLVLSNQKAKARIFDGPQIRKLIKDQAFVSHDCSWVCCLVFVCFCGERVLG